jgi:phosphoglycerol transferase MdoB-like AlkP superfamily enzyme
MLARAFQRLPKLLRFLAWAAALSFAAMLVLRVAFWFAFRSLAGDVPGTELLQAFYLGIKFDLRLTLLICLPPLMLAFVPPLDPTRRPGARRLWVGYFVAAQALVLFLYFVDFGHYSYVRMRLNASLLEHLYPLSVALQMAWETYPVIWGFVAIGVFAALHFVLLRRLAVPQLARAGAPPRKWAARATVSAFVAIYALGIYGKWSWYPLRWSDAYFSNSEFVSALALNPVLFLADTFDNRAQRYDTKKVREHYPLVARYLGVDRPDAHELNFARYVAPARIPAQPFNLVVIHLESFAGFKAGAFGNKLNATPNFDALARDGILFTNFFVPSVPTARAVFSMLTGVPDYNPGRSASRNPLVIGQHTLVNALRDHDRFYFLGGSAAWGNIRGILANNIDNLKVFEEGDYEGERLDAWGVSDLVLFEKALAVLRPQQKPFFAFIQTSGNHRPFTLPQDRRGFELAQLDEQTLRDNGFDSLAAYNGLRFFDHALGWFFRHVRNEPAFRNTVFVMYGDHGNPSANPIPWEQIGLTGFHSPLLIYAPGLIRDGRRIDHVASLVDLLPTSLSLMGVPYLNTGLGRDLLVPRPPDTHFAMVPGGILTDEYYLQRGPNGQDRLYRYRSDAATVDVAASAAGPLGELQRLHDAFYQSALYLLYHNPPRPHVPEPPLLAAR